VRHFGESSQGKWTIDVEGGDFEYWALRIYGTPLDSGVIPIDFSLHPGSDITAEFDPRVTLQESADHRDVFVTSPLAIHFSVPHPTLWTADDVIYESTTRSSSAGSREPLQKTLVTMSDGFDNYSGHISLPLLRAESDDSLLSSPSSEKTQTDLPVTKTAWSDDDVVISLDEFLFERENQELSWKIPYQGRFFYLSDYADYSPTWNLLDKRIMGRYGHRWRYNPFVAMYFRDAAETNELKWTPDFAVTLSSDWWWATSVGRISGDTLEFTIGEWDDYDGIVKHVKLFLTLDDLSQWNIAAYRRHFTFHGTPQPTATTQDIFGGTAVHYQDMYPIVLLFGRKS